MDIKGEKELLLRSIKDQLSSTMLKYSVLPFVVSIVVMYILFFGIAGIGVEELGTLHVESTQTTIQNGVEHTESVDAELSGFEEIVKFLMSYTLTSWLASFLIYAVGGFFYPLSVYIYSCFGDRFFNPIYLKRVTKKAL